MTNKIYLLVEDSCCYGEDDVKHRAFTDKASALKAYERARLNTIRNSEWKEYFDAKGVVLEEYRDCIACLETDGEYFSVYEDGYYYSNHYTVYCKEVELE